jgi:hypothetical protein
MLRTTMIRIVLPFAAASLAAAPAYAQTAPAAIAPSSGPATMPAATLGAATPCNAQSIDSVPGKAWWAQQRWRYASDAAATAAYTTIVTGQSAWPNWFPGDGTQSVLPVGTRFQMAMSPGQPDDKPGGYGTFDNIRSVEDVREYLAVQVVFKPAIDHVVTYEVTNPLPVAIGPVGPQVDPKLCALLPGRWSQFQMLVMRSNEMDYIKAIDSRPIQ